MKVPHFTPIDEALEKKLGNFLTPFIDYEKSFCMFFFVVKSFNVHIHALHSEKKNLNFYIKGQKFLISPHFSLCTPKIHM